MSIKRNKIQIKYLRRNQGMSTFELLAIGFILPILALVCVNIAVLVFAAGINDSACKDAARAAAQRATKEDALDAATAIVGQYSAGGLLGKPQIVPEAFEFDIQADDEGNPVFGGTAKFPGGPHVTVGTKSEVRLPAPLVFNGAALVDHLEFSAQYTFPILNPSQDDDDEEITVSNGPDNAANAASAREDQLAQEAEDAEEQAMLSAEAAEKANADAAAANATAATLDAASATAAANAAANPTNSGLQSAAASAAAQARAADAAAAKAQDAAAKADAKAQNDANIASAKEAALQAAADAIEQAYSDQPTETTGAPADESRGDVDAGS